MAEYEGTGTGTTTAGGPSHVRFQQQQRKIECQTSEEEESRSSDLGGGGNRKEKVQQQQQIILATSSGAAGDGGAGTVEVARKPRGRPPGSKNKPKPPIIITRDSENTMRPLILEVGSGCDVGECIAQFSRRRQIGVCVMSGNGIVSNVTLRQPTSHSPSPSPATAATFHGRYQILSLSGTFLPNSAAAASASASSSATGGLTISLAGTQGQVVGGSVMGPLIAVGPVIIIAAAFMNPSYHRLPMDDEEDAAAAAAASTATVTAAATQGSTQMQNNPPVSDSCGMAIYTNPLSCQVTPDVFAWAASRPPPY